MSFWSSIDATSFQPSDITLESAGYVATVAEVQQINSLTYRVVLQQPLEDGDYQLAIGPDILTDDGMGMDQNWNGIFGEPEDIYRASFSIDTQAPEAVTITSHNVDQLYEVDSRSINIEGLRDDDVSIRVNGAQKVAIGDTAWSIEDYPLDEGLNKLTFVAVDAALNQSEPVVLQVDVDSYGPTFVGVEPEGHINVLPQAVRVEARDEGSGLDLSNSSITVVRDGEAVAGSVQLEGDVLVFRASVPWKEGFYSVDVELGDARGNINAAHTPKFVIDLTAPEVPEVVAHPPATTINTFTFSGSKEPYTGILVDDQLKVSNTKQTSWSYAAPLVEGDNTFTLRTVDRAGNISEPTVVTIRYDDTVPGPVTFSFNPEGNGTSVSLDWSSYDTVANGNDIAQYHVFSATAPFTSVQSLEAEAVIPAGTTSYELRGVSRSEPVYVAVVAQDTSGLMLDEVTGVEIKTVDIQPPPNPSRLNASPGADNLKVSWQPSSNEAGDLAGYRLYVQSDEETDTNDLPVDSLVVEDGAVVFNVPSLQPATGYQLRVTAYDGDGNESSGIAKPGVTLLQNPELISVEPFSGKVELEWSAVPEVSLVKKYRVYASTSPYTSVEGMSARASFPKDQLSGGVAGLENDTTYYVAVTVVNLSGGEDPQVTTMEVTPEDDESGPDIQKLTYFDGAAEVELDNGSSVTEVGAVRIYAEDPSGLSSLKLAIDDVSIGNDHSASPFFEIPWDLIAFDDGEHVLTATAHDTLNNTSERVLTLNVALAPPAAPEILSPQAGTTTNRSEVEVTGQSVAQTTIQVTVNGTLQPDTIQPGPGGQFKTTVPLSEGDNEVTLAAAYTNRGVYGESSAPLTITRDSSAPDAPEGLTAQSKPLGQIALGWSLVDQAEGYRIHRASEPFDVAQGVTQLNSEPLTGTTYQDLPGQDGDYYYRVIAVNKLGTESEPSASASAASDSTAPQATEILYTPHGSYDEASGRYGPGQVDVEVEVSEPLKTTPYLALTVSGGAPMVAELRKDYGSDTRYTGEFVIPETAVSGTAMAVFSAHDKVGNRGSEVVIGDTLVVDAKGPEVSQLSLNPNSPIQNDPDEHGLGRILDVSLTLADDVMPGEMPQLIPVVVTDTGEEVIADYASGITLTRDEASQPGTPVFNGQLQLPVSAGQDDAGEPTSELLGFRYLARDDLGNEVDSIAGNPRFQVYQGDLPPLETPSGLMARALPAGKIELIWSDVENAAGYRLYRQAPGETELTELKQLDFPAEMLYMDGQTAPLADGQYQYAIASVRVQNGQTAVSAMSDPVTVNADATPPDAPENLSLELNGAGVVARWQPPASEVQDGLLEYNLYRVNLPADSQPSDMTSYQPLQNGIPDIIALDSRPSATEHLYAITAVDPAGNESIASNAEYLNVDLLPVSDLSITLPEDGQPTLSWNHAKTSSVEFEVYDVNTSEDTPLHEGRVADRHYVDSGYSTVAGGGATEDRLYRVIAVDPNGVSSVGHDLLLPALNASLNRDESGIDLRRGIMNRVSFRVANAGATDVVQARLRVTVSDNGTERKHWSERFSVAPGGFTDVPVVIGGYEALPTLAPVSVDIVLAPKAGQSVVIEQTEEIQVGQSGLIATLEPEDFVRGATGKVRLVLENPSDVETEVLMARSSGKRASNELRLILKDPDGNTLSEQAVKQGTGDVITLSNGQTVARIPPHDTYQSQFLEVPVPSSAPDAVKVHLEVDHFRYHTGRDTAVAIAGTRASRDVSLKETPYYGELDDITPATVFTGDTVNIKGRALDRQTESVLPNVPLTLVLTTRGIERTFPIYTSEDGSFTYSFTPSASGSGEYRVSVLHPQMVERPEHGSFTVEGAGVSPTRANINIPRNYEYDDLKIRVKSGYATELSNVRLVYAPSTDNDGNPLPAPQGMQYDLGAPKQVRPNSSVYLPLSFSGDASAADEGKLRFHVVADNREQPLDTVVVSYFLSEAKPAMLAQPSLLNTGVSLGESQQETFTLENTGLASANNLQLELITESGDPAPAWFQLLSPTMISSLAVDASAEVQLALSPDSQVPTNDYVFKVRVTGDNVEAFEVPVLVAATDSDTGNVFFHTTDIYTATLDENMEPIPGLGGVKIKLQNTRVLSEEFELKTDAEGFGELKDIPAGRYSYRASAFDHESVSGHLWVKPGVTTDEQLFLMNKLVNVEFSVTEVTLEDRYDIVLEATYETNVPAPVVMFEPMSVNLPMLKKGEVFQGEFTITNHGLIEAYDVAASLPEGDDYARFDYLTEIPDVLSPGQVVRVPYRIVALQDFEPSGDGEATGGGCVKREYKAICTYSAQCAVGTIIDNAATMFWNAVSGSSCGSSSGGSSGSYGGGGYWGGYGGYGGGGVNYSPAPRGEVTVDDDFCPKDCEYCCGNGSGGAGGLGSGGGSGGLPGGTAIGEPLMRF
ncbi:fibronectin type III domain-containing protein [Marinobacter oulmenensis]|uniref:Fibronectin type 3 domain-containing protein n=1 Tax=Marinobacter oulmenensis TaxID=643747 RepID=A0A840UL98_9GAMM|nr:fibronectin type 3 domain-containing protein [Marinobacter oulmenensis]